jgi:hypothetical protein
MGTVGGVTILLAVVWLLLCLRRRRFRKKHKLPSTWSGAQTPIYSLKCIKDPLSQAGDQAGPYNAAQAYPGNHKHHSRHDGKPNGQHSGNAAAQADVVPIADVGAARDGMALGFTGDELQAGLSDVKYVITNRLLPAVNKSQLTLGEVY